MKDYAGSDLEETAAITALLFDLLNRSLFDGRLPTPAFEVAGLRNSAGGLLLGVFTEPGEEGCTVPTIHINPYEADLLASRNDFETWTQAVADTLLHEMVHYHCYVNGLEDCEEDYHTEVFRNEAEAHGLDCGMNENGWNMTSISVKGWFSIMSNLDHETAESLGWEDMI